MMPPMSIPGQRDAGDPFNLPLRISESPVNIARFHDLSREARLHSRSPVAFPATWSLSRLLVLIYLRLFVQHGVEQRTVNLDFSVVVDESLFPEFVHEKAHPGSGGADHFRQGF